MDGEPLIDNSERVTWFKQIPGNFVVLTKCRIDGLDTDDAWETADCKAISCRVFNETN